MKCRKCNAELRDTDKICINCGTLVKNTIDDLYDDINIDEEKDNEIKENKKYSNELDELLNSYHDNQNSVNMTSDYPDYSSFAELNENKGQEDEEEKYEATSKDTIDNYYQENSDSKDDDDFNVDSLVTITDTNSKEYKKEEKKKAQEEKKKAKEKKEKVTVKKAFTTTRSDFSFTLIPFKVVFIIAAVILFVLLAIVIYKVFINNGQDVDHEIKNDETLIKSKYSLEDNPNYILGRTWICGNSNENGTLDYSDTTSYFQYDFNSDSTYANNIYKNPDIIENGRYGVSLEEINDNNYVYKVTLIANLDNSYKTRYSIYLTTSKDGKTATFKNGGKTAVCEEMNSYNSKVKK